MQNINNYSIKIEDLENKNKNSKKKTTINTEKVKAKRNRRKHDKWSDDENNLLKAAVQELGERQWKLIAKKVGTRNADQCNQHWHRVINPKITKSKWTAGEDELLIKRTQLLGESAWKKIAEELIGRTDTQCRHRFKMLMKKKNGVTGKKRKRRTKAEIVHDNLLKNNTNIALEAIQKILKEVKKTNKTKKKKRKVLKKEKISVEPNFFDFSKPNNLLDNNFNLQLQIPITIPFINNIDLEQTKGLFVQGTNIFERIYTPSKEKQDEMNNSLFDDNEVSNSSTGSEMSGKEEIKDTKEDVQSNKDISYSCENLNFNSQLNEIFEKDEINMGLFQDINVNQFFAADNNETVSIFPNCLSFENLICDEKFE